MTSKIKEKYFKLLIELAKQNKLEWYKYKFYNYYTILSGSKITIDLYNFFFFFKIKYIFSSDKEFNVYYSIFNKKYYKCLKVWTIILNYIKEEKLLENEKKYDVYDDIANKIYQENNITFRAAKIKSILK